MYFESRSIAFKKLTGKCQSQINAVYTLGCTVVKVTLGSVSYTVIVKYFFGKGQIMTVLNALCVMSTEYQDGAGTGEMIVNTLMKTLCLSKDDLRNKLEHFSYDGVYELPQHRIIGGGGLV